MSSEHRYRTGKETDIQVHIRYRKRRFSSAQVRKLSEQGMYLDVRAVTLPIGTLVELEFEGLDKEWLITAVVVHHQAGGIGLMFHELQPELYHGLMETQGRQIPSRCDPMAAERSWLC